MDATGIRQDPGGVSILLNEWRAVIARGGDRHRGIRYPKMAMSRLALGGPTGAISKDRHAILLLCCMVQLALVYQCNNFGSQSENMSYR